MEEDAKQAHLEVADETNETPEDKLDPNQAHSLVTPAGYSVPKGNDQLNDRGYFDVKFYHNRLW